MMAFLKHQNYASPEKSQAWVVGKLEISIEDYPKLKAIEGLQLYYVNMDSFSESFKSIVKSIEGYNNAVVFVDKHFELGYL